MKRVKPAVTPSEPVSELVWIVPCARAGMESPSPFVQMRAIVVREIRSAVTPLGLEWVSVSGRANVQEAVQMRNQAQEKKGLTAVLSIMRGAHPRVHRAAKDVLVRTVCVNRTPSAAM